jgi:subtilisin family serine protease
MKQGLLFIVLLTLSILCGSSVRALSQSTLSVSAPKEADVAPGVLYLQFKAKHGIDFEHLSPSHTGNAEVDALFSSIGVTDIYPFDQDAKNFPVCRRHGIDRMYVINYDGGEGLTPHDIGHNFLKIGVIENASPRYIYHTCYTPNDPSITDQYALDKMRIKDAWGISKGDSNIVIADIDVGVNYLHEDLAGNIFPVEGHIGKDIVGDNGWFRKFQPDFDPMPHLIPGIAPVNHGTITSGCFGAIPDNGVGIAGSGFSCKIMIVKVANDSGGLIFGGNEGITYAATHGAKILNCSWGGNVTDPAAIAFDQEIINMAIDTGVMIVAAAGNNAQNLDNAFFDPACLNNVLCVGATDNTDQVASFSNYGKEAQVYAPGTAIYSTSFPGNSFYEYDQGTSFSSPLTSGVAGLVWKLHPDWTQKFVMRQLIQTCDNVVTPLNRAKYWGRINAYNAVSQVPSVPGLGATDFSVDGVDKGSLAYLNKTYSLNVTFKNFMGPGSGIIAKLLHVDGTATDNGGYSIQLGTANLGTMNALGQAVGAFKFTRDTTDQGAGSQLTLFFAISYGTATVENQKYYDTLRVNIDITGDGGYVVKSVKQENSSAMQLTTFPNPVSGDATISFDLTKSEYAKLSICDMLGRKLEVISEAVAAEGKNIFHFDSKNFANGVYLCTLETADGAETSRIVVVH